jgi:periplasmic protein TonB
MILKNRVIFSVLLVFLSLSAFAAPLHVENYLQIKNTPDTLPVEDTALKIFQKVEIEAAYPGGDKAWIQFLQLNLDAGVPAKKRAPVGTYTVVIEFVVDKDGNISDIKSLTKHGYGMEEEVVKVLKKSPHWKPAVQDGRKVRAYRKQPVTFQVAAEEKKKKRSKDE